MTPTITTNADAFSKALTAYAVETGKSVHTALMREAPDFALAMYQETKAAGPTAAQITASIVARGWRMRRHNRSTAPANLGSNLSNAAVRAGMKAVNVKAKGQQQHNVRQSDWFRSFHGSVAPLRFSVSGKKVILGGRSGYRFSKKSKRVDQLRGQHLKNSETLANAVAGGDWRAFYGAKRLNWFQLATLRQSQFTARGNRVFAAQWLHKGLKKMKPGERRDAKSKAPGIGNATIGNIEFVLTQEGKVSGVILTGRADGAAKFSAQHDIVNKVFAKRAPALMNAIQMHLAKKARKEAENA